MDLLLAGAAQLGVDLTSSQLDQFTIYYQELVEWNRRANLTNITEFEEVQVKHFLDSLTVLPAAGDFPFEGRLLDVGAGAGFPGLPLKLVHPGLKLAMSKPVGKKVAFLEHMVETLEIEECQVLRGRAESLARDPGLREGFDLVTARGLARMPVLVEYCLPFCRIGGAVACWKHGGANFEEELAGAERALELLGGEIKRVCHVETAGLTDNRIVVMVEKIHAAPEAYPRRTGIPSKRPL